MAGSFGVNDASGPTGSIVQVPIEIVNTVNGPIQTIIFYMDYDESVILLDTVITGPLTSGWMPIVGGDKHSITLTTLNMANAIPDGSTGIVGYLNFQVLGSPGATSLMTPQNLDFSNTANQHGTALAIIGLFSVTQQQMADSFGVNDASGSPGNIVSVPIEINNVMNGPIQTIIFNMDYDESVILLDTVVTGPLTSSGWMPIVGGDKHSITLTTLNMANAIPDGSTGIVGYLNFQVLGSPGATSLMTPQNIDFSNTANQHGTAPAIIGTFDIPMLGSISGVVSYSYVGGGPINGVTVDLKQGGVVIDTTSTNALGEYSFTDLSPGTYDIEFNKLQFYDEIDSANVVAGINTVVNINLRFKGDLDNNGQQADAVDVNMMIQASVGDIPSDRYFDLDNNEQQADAVDVNMMIQASVGDIILNGLTSASEILLGGSLPMVESFGINDASGEKGSKLSVPFEIENTANGPIQTIKFSIDYNESVISLKSVDYSSLTSDWIVTLGKDKHSITMTTFDNTNTIADGLTGIAGYFNFNVVGKPGDTTSISLNGIDFSNINNEHGISVLETNGTFSVTSKGGSGKK